MRIIFVLLLLVSANAYAQQCNCDEAFSAAVARVQTNYSGFRDKVTEVTKAAYELHTDSLQQQARLPQNQLQASCLQIIRTWMRFFKDGHIQAYLSGGSNAVANADSIRNLYKGSEKVALTETAFLKYLQKKMHPLEGIWRNEDGNYRIGMIKEGAVLKGFILKADSVYWMPGQVKLKIYEEASGLRTDYYMGNHDLQQKSITANAAKNTLIIDGLGQWLKVDAATGLILNKEYYAGSGVVQLKKLSDQTLLLTIRSFNEGYRALIDSILTSNHDLITRTPNLIIDVRGNGGGSDFSFHPLLKYLYTHPYQRVTAEALCTDDNIDRYRRMAQMDVFTKEEKENFIKRAAEMEKHKGTFWTSAPVYIDAEPQTAQAVPQKVAVIIDGGCASTTEQLLLDAVSNSAKTKIYGIPTAGVLDYANMDSYALPGTNIGIAYATSRSRRIDIGKGIDNVGVQPHVLMGKEVSDWIKAVQQDLEKK